MRSKEVALVLSSGGARGIAHIGVIQSLLEEGYTIKSISGSSMGGVIGGFYAAGYLDNFTEWICSLSKMDVFRLMDFTLSSQGFIKGYKVFDEMKKFIEDVNIEDMDIPFSAIAADISTREEVVFNSGSLLTALRATVAIPSILTPYEVDGVQLVDGGVVNPIPIQHVSRTGNEILVSVDVNAMIPYEKAPDSPERKKEKKKEQDDFTKLANQLKKKWEEIFPEKPPQPKKLGLLDLMSESLSLMQSQLSQMTIEKYNPDIQVAISNDACATFDFHKSREMIKEGKRAFSLSYEKFLAGESQ